MVYTIFFLQDTSLPKFVWNCFSYYSFVQNFPIKQPKNKTRQNQIILK